MTRPRRILHLVLPRLATDRLARERARRAADAPRADTGEPPLAKGDPPRGAPLSATGEPPRATIAKSRGALVLAAVDERAAAAGLQPGQGLADARAMVPALLVDPADPEADAAALSAIALAADRYTPLVAPVPPDGLFLDITGCAHLFGGEAGLVGDLLARLARAGYAAAVAVADRPAVAWALARHGAGGRVPTGGEIAAVAPLPVAALQLPEEMVAVLHRVGLRTVGDVLAQPRAPLVHRFGPLLARRIDAIEGRISEPITPVLPVPPVMAERRFAEPVADVAPLEAALGALGEEVARLLARRGEGARTLRLRLFHASGDVGETAVGTSEPMADGGRMRALLAPRLHRLAERIEVDSGIDLVRLHADDTGPLLPRQVGFDGAEQMAADLARLIDTLSERLGAERVRRFVPVDTHDPARAALTLPAREVARRPPATALNVPSLARATAEVGSHPSPAVPVKPHVPGTPAAAVGGRPDLAGHAPTLAAGQPVAGDGYANPAGPLPPLVSGVAASGVAGHQGRGVHGDALPRAAEGTGEHPSLAVRVTPLAPGTTARSVETPAVGASGWPDLAGRVASRAPDAESDGVRDRPDLAGRARLGDVECGGAARPAAAGGGERRAEWVSTDGAGGATPLLHAAEERAGWNAHHPGGAGGAPAHGAAGPLDGAAVPRPSLLPGWAVERPPERPIRLFTPPEPVETVAGVPDGPPIRFRWRRVAYIVAAAEGPERIAPAWWEGRGETADYFRVEDVEGRRFWMFRRGLYGEAVLPRWFVHGLFA